MGEHALPPQKSHRAYPSTSLKKTILPDIYFNKIHMKLIMDTKMGFLKLKTLTFAHLNLFLLMPKLHEFGP